MSFRKEATTREALTYGFGNIASNVFFIFIGTYLMVFYTDIMGIPAITAGTIFMVARLVDAFTDPLMGMIADRTNTRMGRYRPYVLIGAPILSALFVGMFIVPDLSPMGKIIYSYTIYILFSLARTVVQISYTALSALVSTDPDKRTWWIAIKQLFGTIGLLIGLSIGLPLLNAFGGLANPRAWTMTTLVYAILITVIYFISMQGCKKIDPPRVKTAKTKAVAVERGENSKISLKKQFKYIFGNLPLLLLVISFGTDSLAMQTTNAINLNFFRYYLGRVNLFPITSFIGIGLSFIVALVIITPLIRRFGKRKTIIFGELMAIIPLIFVLFIPRQQVLVILVLTTLTQLFATISALAFWTAVPDCSDYAEWKYGGEAAGAAASTTTFMNKLAQAFGAMVAGVILSATGYVAKAPVQNESVLTGLLYAKTLIPIGAYLCSIIAMYFYPLTKSRLKEITTELNETRKIAS